MNYNEHFEDIMDSINNTAQGYGFKNGIDWANTAQRSGEISYDQYKKYENAHNLRVRFSHGNARDIRISPQTYEIAQQFEYDVKHSNLRKKRDNFNNGPKLPNGTFRYNKPFVKEFNWEGSSGRRYYFRFEIIKEYQERAYDDGTRFSGTGYTIYVKEAPYKDWCLEHNREIEFHYYDSPHWNPSICWNTLIEDFDEANSVMFVWAKRYIKILDNLLEKGEVNMDRVDRTQRRGILPSGTFRFDAKNTKTIYIEKTIYDKIINILGKRKPELGGMLGWTLDQDSIDSFIFDENAKVDDSAYSPNVEYLSKIINDDWAKKHINLGGFVHSHPRNCGMLSDPDVEYAIRIMEAFELDYLFMPIVTSSYEYKTEFNPYIILRNGNIVKCKIKTFLSKKVEDKKVNNDKLEEIEKAFDSMGKKCAIKTENDSIFSRIEQIFDLDYLKKSSIIGVGCGGAKNLYENLARMGIGNFFLIDGDKSSLSNIASQNAYLSEVNIFKPDALKQRLLNINPEINVRTFNFMLDDNITDEYFENEILKHIDIKNTVLCAFTDNFYAQARISRLSLKYNIPFVSAQHHEKGLTSEVIYWYPNITRYSLREIAKTRYESFENGFVNNVTSYGSPIFNTTRLNSICEKIIIGLLVYSNNEKSEYCSFIKNNSDRNLILIKQGHLNEEHPLFSLFDNSPEHFFDDVVWCNPESLEKATSFEYEKNIIDSRVIFEKEKL